MLPGMDGRSEFALDDGDGARTLVRLDRIIAGLGVRLAEVDAELSRLHERTAMLRRAGTGVLEKRTLLASWRETVAADQTATRPAAPAHVTQPVAPAAQPAPVNRPAPAPQPPSVTRPAPPWPATRPS